MKLRKFNVEAAQAIAEELKNSITISHKTLVETFFETRQNGEAPLGSWPMGVHVDNLSENNYKNIVNLLLDKKLMTKQNINGFKVYVATRKLIHSKIENLF